MGRLPRYLLPGHVQHVIHRGNNRCRLFAARDDYLFMLNCLARASKRHCCQIHAYVLMANHMHLLLTQSSVTSLSKMMQSVGCRYVKRFNTTYERTGTLWEGRYRASPVQTERYLLTCYRYIELNPVRAGLVNRPDDYVWSSYRANALGGVDTLITPHHRYSALGSDLEERHEAYRALFRDSIDEVVLRAIRSAAHLGRALRSVRSDEDFLRRRRVRRPSRIWSD